MFELTGWVKSYLNFFFLAMWVFLKVSLLLWALFISCFNDIPLGVPELKELGEKKVSKSNLCFASFQCCCALPFTSLLFLHCRLASLRYWGSAFSLQQKAVLLCGARDQAEVHPFIIQLLPHPLTSLLHLQRYLVLPSLRYPEYPEHPSV